MPTVDELFNNPTGWMSPSREIITPRDVEYARNYVGMLWKRLEFEEQAHARKMMRARLVIIEGTGAARRVAWAKREG